MAGERRVLCARWRATRRARRACGNDLDAILLPPGGAQGLPEEPGAGPRAATRLAVETIEQKQERTWLGVFSSYPPAILCGAIELMQMFVGHARGAAGASPTSMPARFESEGSRQLFAMLREGTRATSISPASSDHLRGTEVPRRGTAQRRTGRRQRGRRTTCCAKPRRTRPNWLERLSRRRRRRRLHLPHPPIATTAGARALSRTDGTEASTWSPTRSPSRPTTFSASSRCCGRSWPSTSAA
ncbi:MAG: hypothetical protein MZW92_37270 [Comamonadaceae bacterium]|nr:hypothetical protein [Comamonadaceae bacterium]